MAARGGSVRPRYGAVARIGWHARTSVYQTRDVAKLAPNGYGLYDVLGNVWEWTADHASGLPSGTDPISTGSGDMRVIRGGSYSSYPVDLRVSSRYSAAGSARDYSIGFRCVWDH
jgi:formylglycine-generating enzyme required for sulfatase activity